MNESKPDYRYGLLLAVSSVLALLIGLVRSADRGTRMQHGEREPPAHALIAPGVAMRVPVIPVPLEEAPAPRVSESADTRQPNASERRGVTRLVGIVLRPEGEPAAKARVVLGQQHALCAPDGSFELVLSSDPGAGDLIAYEPGYEPELFPAFGAGVRPNHDNQVRVVLGPSTYSLHGTVMSPDGRPLKGWTVELDEIDPLATFGLRESVRTDADGTFLIADVPAGVHVVRAFRQRREQAFRSDPIAAGETGLTITVDQSN